MFSSRDTRRGSDRGRARVGAKRSWRGRASDFTSTLRPERPFGATIDSIDIKTLLTEKEAPVIQGVSYVASYNWPEGESSVILTPGSPPVWSPPAEDIQLSPDSKDVFRDINAARHASYPMEPMFRSLAAMAPEQDVKSVDLAGCGNTLGSLLSFARSEQRGFRFDVDVIGDVVLFVRKGSSPTELIPGLQGYGHTFPEAYTTWDDDVRGSCSHQRIVRYEFGGLEILVRSESDGYVKDATDAESPASAGLPADTETPVKSGQLGEALDSMSVSSMGAAKDPKLKLKIQGVRIRQDQIFDIKTRASYRTFEVDAILPRLWVNQTSKSLIAYHKFGLFERPEVKDVRKEVLQWEKDNSAMLARFHALVKRIVDVVRGSEAQQFEVSWDGQGPLRITKQVGEVGRALPAELFALLGGEACEEAAAPAMPKI